VIESNPQYTEAFTVRAIAHLMKGDNTKSNEDMQRAKELQFKQEVESTGERIK